MLVPHYSNPGSPTCTLRRITSVLWERTEGNENCTGSRVASSLKVPPVKQDLDTKKRLAMHLPGPHLSCLSFTTNLNGPLVAVTACIRCDGNGTFQIKQIQAAHRCDLPRGNVLAADGTYRRDRLGSESNCRRPSRFRCKPPWRPWRSGVEFTLKFTDHCHWMRCSLHHDALAEDGD
jgi:hypothetical protein